MRTRRPLWATAPVTFALAVGALTGTSAAAPVDSASDSCSSARPLTVPGAEHQMKACLDDLTTAGTTVSGHTDPADWAGLHPAGAVNPTGVPGIQIDGYFPDTSTFNTSHGWNHDSQFVLRLPDRLERRAGRDAAPPATGSSTPTTSPSPTGRWPRATRTP